MRILRLRSVEEKIDRRHSFIYDQIKKGRFPRPITLGTRSVGWLETEINDWIAARVAERDAHAEPDGQPRQKVKCSKPELLTEPKLLRTRLSPPQRETVSEDPPHGAGRNGLGLEGQE